MENGVTLFEYDLAGRLLAKVSPGNYVANQAINTLNRTTYVYDGMGRLQAAAEIYKPVGSANFITVVTETNTYDKNGNLLTKKDALNNITTYA